MNLGLTFVTLGPVVDRPVNANRGLKVNRGLCFSTVKSVSTANFKL